MRTCFQFFADDSHGWLRVTDDDLKGVGLHRDQFSRYSYSDGSYVYLEEDMDAALFFAAYEAKTGRKPEIIENRSNGESLIRINQRLPGSAYSFEGSLAMIRGFRDQAAVRAA